jgi:hypothetical protein
MPSQFHSYGVRMPTREHRLATMGAITLIASTIALLGSPWLSLNVQLVMIAVLAGWAGVASLWFP